jgi:hypothetical protein
MEMLGQYVHKEHEYKEVECIECPSEKAGTDRVTLLGSEGKARRLVCRHVESRHSTARNRPVAGQPGCGLLRHTRRSGTTGAPGHACGPDIITARRRIPDASNQNQ